MRQVNVELGENGRFEARHAEVDALNQQADFFNSRHFKQNLALSQKAYALAAIEPIYLSGMATARLHSGYANVYFDQFEKAQQQLFDALLIYEQLDDWRGQAACHTMLGVIQWRLANYAASANHHEKALLFIEKVNDARLDQYILMNLGLQYTATASYEEAIATYELILEKYQDAVDLFFQSIIYNNLTMFHFHANNLDEAHEWALKSLALAKQFDDPLLRSTVLDSLGTVLLAKQQPVAALSYFQESETLAREGDFKSNCVVALLNKGRAYQQLDENEQALNAWQEALVLGEVLGLREQQRQVHQLLTDFYKQQGHLSRALEHFDAFHQLEKAILQDTVELKLKTLHLSHEVNVAKAQNEVLRQAMAEQQTVEAALRKSEQEYKELFTLMRLMCDNVPDMIWAKSLDGRYLFANQALCDTQLFAQDSSEPIGKTKAYFIERIKQEQPDDPSWYTLGKNCQAYDDAVFATEEAQRYVDYGNVRGQFFFLDVCKAPFRNEVGELIGVVGCARNITKEKLQEAEKEQITSAMRQSEKRFRSIVENMPVMIDAFDERRNIVFWNKECERVTGYSAAEVVNKPGVLSMFYPDAGYLEKMVAFWEENRGNNYQVEWEISCKDGSKRTVAWSNISDRYPIEGWANWSIGIDVTDRQRAEAALRYAQKMESLGILAGGIAHDFNNLLVSILGHMSLAATKLPQQHIVVTHIEKAMLASEKAANLTKKMLAYSGRGHFVVESLGFNETVKEAISLLQSSWPRELGLQTHFEQELPPIAADKGQLKQIVRSLILNGIEAVGEQAGQIGVRTTAVFLNPAEVAPWEKIVGQPVAPGSYVCLEVTDSGLGMEPERVSHIFDPFFTTKQPAHHGLGLAAVLGIVRGHQGGVQIQSKPDVGTTIRVILPATNDPVPEKEELSSVSIAATDLKILIIDDQEAVLEAVTDILELEGFVSVSAKGGQEGIDLLSQQPDEIQLVILDMFMPGLSGEETFRQLRQIQPNVPVLFSSGYDQKTMRGGVPKEANVAFIQKPYQFQPFIDKVKQLIQQSNA